jgi:DNA-binding LacI/PurR family transcriptional regulator
MKATIRDVAKAAGVSIGTVSRVLNGHTAVSDESRTRVDKVVRSLNYNPLRKRRISSSAKRLSGKRIAIVLLGMDRSLSSAPLLLEVIHGVEAVVAEWGASLELLNLSRLDEVPVVLRQDSLNGLILFGALQGNMVEAAKPALIRRLSALPSVWFIRRPEGCWGDSVGPNDWLVGKLAAEYLTERGHRQIAFLNPRGDQATWRLRGVSLTSHAQDFGAEVRSYLGDDEKGAQFPLRTNHNAGTIEKLIDGLLNQRPRPTALFIPADSIAPLVYRALASRGVQVGQELSVMSCNHERPFTEALHPTLTTLDIHAELMGRMAAKQLAARLRGGAPHQPAMEISLEPTILEGESVAELAK